MSALGEALGGQHEFHHNGKTYRVKLITQDVKLQFERSLFARARDAAAAMRTLMDRDDYARHLKALNDDYLAGEYAFESARGLASLKTISGMLSLACLLFGCDQPEMLTLISQRQADVQALIGCILKESFPGQAEAEPSTAPATEGEGDLGNVPSPG